MLGSHRCELVEATDPLAGRSPARTHDGLPRGADSVALLEAIRPFLASAGITRLACITGLDRIGLPTASAMRPAARTLSVAAGKGLTVAAAMVAAALEALEVFSAESVTLPEIRGAARELGASHRLLPPGGLAVRPHSLLGDDLPLRWTFGRDLLEAGRCVAVPVDAVTLAPPREVSSPIRQSSDGLAAGAGSAEAILAALLESIERQAVTRARRAGLRRVDLDGVASMPVVGEVLDRLRRADVEVAVYDCAADNRIPVYLARIWDGHERHTGIFFGSGAHLDPAVALLRALLEAAQSRVVYISGSRDDLLSHEYRQVRAQDSPAIVAALRAQPTTVAVREPRAAGSALFEADVARVLDSLRQTGVQRVVAVDLTPPSLSEVIAVWRVVVPERRV